METTTITPIKFTAEQLKGIIYGFEFPHIELNDCDYDDKGNMYGFYRNTEHNFHYSNDDYLLTCSLYIDEKIGVDVNKVKLFDREDEILLSEDDKYLIEKELEKHITW